MKAMKGKKEEDIELNDEELDDSVVAEGQAQDAVKKLKGKVKDAEAKAKEYLDGWQRAKADFANLRRRDEEAKQEFVKFANVGIIEALIPVLDSFNIALSQDHKESKHGLEALYNQLFSALKANGLEELDPLGEDFSPQEHEALSTVDTDKEDEDDRVLEVLQKGYKLHGRVVRPAKVKVGECIINQPPTTNH